MLALPTGSIETSALLVEWFGPDEVREGRDFQAEIQVTNLADVALDSVIVNSTIDENFQMRSSTPAAAVGSAGMRAWKLGRMVAGETRTITIEGLAKKSPAIATCLSASYENAMCVQIPVVAPALKLVAKGPAAVLECDDLVYEYVVTNTGTGAATGVVFDPMLPAGLDPVGDGAAKRQLGTLRGGESRKVSLRLDPTKVGSFEHTAVAVAAGDLSAKAQGLKTVVSKPVLAITGAGMEKQFAGRQVGYEFTVKNVGKVAATDTSLVVQVPAALAFRSAGAGGTFRTGKVSWKLGALAPDAIRTVSMVLATERQGDYTVQASVEARCADAVDARVRTAVVGIPALLLEVVDVEDPIVVGQEETYVIEVTNQGTAPATNVVILVDVPENCTFVSATGSSAAPAAPDASGKLKLAALGSLAPKAKASWRIVLRGDKSADARFGVQMTSDQLETPVNETEATTFYE